MRALLIGAVESTAVALRALAASPLWDLAGLLTLPVELAARHSDFVDLGPASTQAGATLIRVADGSPRLAVGKQASRTLSGIAALEEFKRGS